jgi:transglutaminase-like putative cysteine protease
MFYSIKHQTRFRYDSPVSESLMELRMQPRSEWRQRCASFFVKVLPRARVLNYRDHLGNQVHQFNVAAKHTELLITAEAMVETFEPEFIPDSLPDQAWAQLDDLLAKQDYWEFLLPSEFAEPTPLLLELAASLRVERRADPLSLVRQVNEGVYRHFEYVPKHTDVNSPIDHALRDRKGVCQDFAHVAIALLRLVKIPCRYVSGYVFHSPSEKDRSRDGATHAWIEAFLPTLGWVGFDPTNNLLAGERHIRTSIGRDYGDVPPTRGIFRGNAQSELAVIVRVSEAQAPLANDPMVELQFNAHAPVFDDAPARALQEQEAILRQQQQQQQQQ